MRYFGAYRHPFSAAFVSTLLLLVPAIVCGQNTPTVATASVRGTVVGPDNVPIDSAVVEVVSIGRVRTDSAGTFQFTALPVGAFILQATKIGFRPAMKLITTRPGEQLVVPIALDASSQDLPRVIVRGDSAATLLSDPSGFDVRRRGGLATFVTADQIAARHFMQTIDVFRTIPGVELDRNGTVAIQRGEIKVKKVCAGAQLLVDGVPMAPGPAPLNARDGAKSTAFDINEIPVSSIRGIEIYSGPASTPMVLRTENPVCGTVAIWTK